MRTTSIISLIRQTLLVISTQLTFSLFGQNGSVLTTLSSQELNKMRVEDGALHSVDAETESVFRSLSVTGMHQAFPSSRTKALQQVYQIDCKCDANDLYKAVAELDEHFSKVEMVAPVELLFETNDFSTSGQDYALNLINAKQAWDVTKGDSSVVIAITDGGYYYNHEDLMGKYNLVTPNSNPNIGHGTAVALTAAGKTNNGIGKSSIGYNSSLQLRAMSYDEVLSATYSGAKVINMSWAAGCFYSEYGQAVITEAYANGSILVAAAGNGTTCGGPDNLVYPAAYDHVIAVSSVGASDNHERYVGDPTSTHQHNSSVDICAPGYDMLISWAPGAYGAGNGTSFAAPLVSGTIALMLSVNPCLTSEQVEAILKSTAVNIDAVNPSYAGKLGAGRIDAGAAVAAAAHFGTYTLNGSVSVSCQTMEQGLSVDLSNVTAPYTITWSTGDTTQTISNVSAGNYECIVRNANGCLGVFTASVSALSPITVTSDFNHPLCHDESNGSIEITPAGGNGNYSYLWSNGSTQKNLYHLTAGAYQLVVTDGNGCTATENYELSNPAQLTAALIIAQNYYYTEGSMDLQVAGGTAPYTYSWNTGDTQEDLSTTAAGFYEVLVTDAHGCMTSANGTLNTLEATEADANVHETSSVSGNIKYQGADNYSTATEATATVNELGNEVVVEAYPNPSTESIKVSWAGTSVSKIMVFDAAGQIVLMNDVTNADQMMIDHMTAGTYTVKLFSNETAVVTKRVMFN